MERVEAVVERYEERTHAPLRWALFHGRMAETLPGWRWLAVRHHRRMARRYAAHAWALDGVAAARCGLAGA